MEELVHTLTNRSRKDARSSFRWLGLVFFAALWLVPAMGQENSDCFACHSDKALTGTKTGKSFPVFIDEKRFGESVHSALTCVSCHTDLEGKELPHAEGLAEVKCGTCHATERFMEKLLLGEMHLHRGAKTVTANMISCRLRIACLRPQS